MEIEKILAMGNSKDIVGVLDSDIKYIEHDIEKIKNSIIACNGIQNYFSNLTTEEKLLKALNIFGLEKDILDKNYQQLSFCEWRLISLVNALIDKNICIVFYYPELVLNFSEIQNFKRIIKKLINYKEKIFIITNRVDLLFDFVNRLIVINEDEVDNFSYPIDWYNENIYKNIDEPKVVEFVNYCRSKGIKLEDYIETKEVLKAIYRSVGK